eukprot:m.4256 g.4256  ORF g.4256 m.4256 type:complete len:76 (-) comp2943_c0_seq1:111-338(-)
MTARLVRMMLTPLEHTPKQGLTRLMSTHTPSAGFPDTMKKKEKVEEDKYFRKKEAEEHEQHKKEHAKEHAKDKGN